MKNIRLEGWVRVLIILSGLALFAVLLLPIWRIELAAPQYPEGLVLQIFANKISGDVDIINGLNHYIGMKTLHTEDFIEFSVLPYLVVAFALLFIIVAFMNRKKFLYFLLAAFIIFGVVAMTDFYRWNYYYGHDLNPHAAIKVPGMAYQPPLIGYKQLLNFGAYSIPDKGGWLFIGAGLVLCLAVFGEWRAEKLKNAAIKKTITQPVATAILITLITALAGCKTDPQPLKIGVDNCYFCKMTISDARFGAEVITAKGKYYKFDDTHCLLSFLTSDALEKSEIADIYLVEFSGSHALVNADKSMLLKSDDLRSPMGGNIAAFTNADSLKEMIKLFNGTETSWKELYQQ